MPKLNIPTLSAIAAIGFALAAAPVYAQDATLSEKEAVMDAAEETMEAAEDVMDAAEEINAPDTSAEPVMQDESMMSGDAVMQDGTVTAMDKQGVMSAPSTTMPKPQMQPQAGSMPQPMQGETSSAPAMSAPTPAATMPVSCPSGTTAQADGTCLVTGEWNG